MTTAVVVLTVLAALAIVGALQVLFRQASGLDTEAHLRPLRSVGRTERSARPTGLTQLEALVADVAAGDRAAVGRLAARMAAAGVDPGPDPTADGLLSTLGRLGWQPDDPQRGDGAARWSG